MAASRWAAAALALLGWFPLLAAGAGASSSWAELWSHRTQSPVLSAAIGDVMGVGSEQLVVVIGERVTIYELGEEGPRFMASLDEHAPKPRAVAVADYDGDGIDEIWIGTDAPGVIDVVRFDGETRKFTPVERARYTWDNVDRVVPLNLDGYGMLDVAALNVAGDLSLFRWTPDGYQEARLGELGKEVRHFEVADLRGVGRDSLILARGHDQAVVAEWRIAPAAEVEFGDNEGDPPDVGEGSAEIDLGVGSLEKVWETFVWGSHNGLFVGRFDGAGALQIAIPSTQRLLSLYAHAGSAGIQLARAPLDWPRSDLRSLSVGDLDGDGFDEVIEAQGDVLVGWKLVPTVRGDVAAPTSSPTIGAFLLSSDSGIVVGPWGFALLRRVPSDYVRILHEGARFEPRRPPFMVGETPFLSLEDWSRLTGMALRFSEDTGLVFGIRGFHFLLGDVHESSWIFDGRPYELESLAQVVDGVVYVGPDFATMIGVDVLWETFSRTLVVQP